MLCVKHERERERGRAAGHQKTDGPPLRLGCDPNACVPSLSLPTLQLALTAAGARAARRYVPSVRTTPAAIPSREPACVHPAIPAVAARTVSAACRRVPRAWLQLE